jgi:hypothetical protein
MPNHGILCKHLFGVALSICDRLVLDQNLNLFVGNVLAGNVCGTLVTSELIEKDSLQGISLCGNLTVKDGFFLRGNVQVDSTVMVNGTFTGDVTVGGMLTAQGGVCSNVILVNTLSPKTGTAINVVSGDLNVVDGCFTVPKSVNTVDGENEVSSATPAGVAQLLTLSAIAPGDLFSVLMTNPCVTADSVVLSTVGPYNDVLNAGVPVVHRVEPGAGSVLIVLTNTHPDDSIPDAITIPIHYLIV